MAFNAGMTGRMLRRTHGWRTLNNINDDTKRIDFSLGEVDWHNRAYAGAVPVAFDAEVMLMRRGAVWFREPLAVGELLLQVENWLVNVQSGSIQNFEYHSIETEENPVIAVVRDPASERWQLTAAWALFTDKADLSDGEVVDFMDRLREAIAAGVRAKYGDVAIR